MKCFYIDTTSSFLYAGIIADDKILASIKEELGMEMSEKSFGLIKDLFLRAQLELSDIDKIILLNGPGSFTGTRIGVTIAKTLAWSANIKISCISSLLAMSVSSDSQSFKIPLLDARRGHVFAAIYDQDNNIVMKEQYISLEVLKLALGNLSDNYVFITNDELALNNKEEYNPDLLRVVNKAKEYEAVNPHGVDANYLKLTEAEEKKSDS